jgi:butyryl-CoA dehydrogenase
MATEIAAARYMVYGASQMKDSGVRFSKESAMAKLFASEVGNRVCYQAIQVLGEAGCATGKFSAERMYRDVKLCEIGEGTSEVQRIVIARDVLKSFLQK